jgi:hypothetical protein
MTFVCFLFKDVINIENIYRVGDRVINKYGAIGGMRISRGT